MLEMASFHMDTYKIVQLLQEKGYSKEQAEGFIETIQHIALPGVATKEDIHKSDKKADKIHNELKQDIASLRSEIAEVRSELKEEINSLRTEVKEDVANLRNDLTKLIYINTITTIGILTAVIALFKLFG